MSAKTVAAVKDWRAAMRLLVAKWPERWKPTQRTEITSPEDRPIQVNVEDARERLIARMDAARRA